MAHGKTLEMQMLSESFKYYPKPEWVKKDRDRSLHGKARVKARKEAQRAARRTAE